VENDRMVGGLIRDLLAPIWDVTLVERVHDALELLEDQRFDAVLSDLELGTGAYDGKWLLDRVRERNLMARRVLMSAHAAEDALARDAVPAPRFLAKPFTFHQLLAALRE
jgi:DNA-binding NtrC family response regulator